MGKVLSVCCRDKRHDYDDLRQEFDATDYDMPLPSVPRATYSLGERKANRDTTITKEHSLEEITPTLSIRVAQEPLDRVEESSRIEKGTTDFPFLQDASTRQYLQGSQTRTMFIMRGLSGSGKSTVVDEILKKYPFGVVCSADTYFMKDGEYHFNKGELSAAHQMCQSKADGACRRGERIIIIDNTNVRRWEFKAYLDLARKFGYTYILVSPRTSWRNNAAELAKRNRHQVDLQTIQKKLRLYEEYVPFYYGWFLNPTTSASLMELSKKCLLGCVKKNAQLRLNMFGDTNGWNCAGGTYNQSDNQKFMVFKVKNEEQSLFVCDENDHPDSQVLEYFRMDKDNTGKILHCTAKFLGSHKNPAIRRKEYNESLEVQGSIGKAFTIELTGMVISAEVVGLRVKLLPESLKLYDKPEEKENDKAHLQKKYVDEQVSIMDDTEIPEFHDLPVTGRSAHITIATANGVPPKRTNEVLLDACDIEHSLDMAGKTLSGVRIEQGSIRQLKDQFWTVTFDKPTITTTLFGGY